MITGTNGKTLTTALTVGILQEAFGPILTNPSGANMISGITTTFIRAKHSKSNRPIAVLEIDEASLSRICDYIQPSLFVVTNIFRDQMDRYGEIYTTYQMILDAIQKVPTATVLLNGDSPLFNSQTLSNPIQYYGFTIRKASCARIATISSSTNSILMPILEIIFVNTVASTGRLSLMHYRICSLSLRILRNSGFKAKTTTSILVAFTTFTMPWQLFPLQDSLEFNRK